MPLKNTPPRAAVISQAGRRAGPGLRRLLALAPLWTLLWGGCPEAPPPEPMPAARDPLLPYLPELPPEGGPRLARAGRLTLDNFAKERIAGPAAQGRIGDFFMANDRIRVVIQQPGRAIAPVPYGGNVIDLEFVDSPVGDQFGELGLLLLAGRTANFTEAELVRDGSGGGPAVLRFRGADVLDDYFDVRALPAVSSLFRRDLLPDNVLGLKLAVTYILSPGSDSVEIVYTLYNPGSAEVRTSWGNLVDAGGEVDGFSPGLGFAAKDAAGLIQGPVPLAPYHVQQGQGVTYGFLPLPAVPPSPSATGERGALVLPISGVSVAFYDLGRKQDLFTDAAFTINLPAGGGTMRRVLLALGRSDPWAIEKMAQQLRSATEPPMEQTVELSGKVSGTQQDERVRVGIRKLDWADHEEPNNVYTMVQVTGGAGETAFTVRLPPGTYTLRAEATGLRKGAAETVVVPAQSPTMAPIAVRLAVPQAARIHYRILDEEGQPMPGKLTLVGETPEYDAAMIRGSEGLDYGIAAQRRSLSGDSALGGRFDGPLLVPPGTYRAVVSHGPEWSRHEEKLTLSAGQEATVSAHLYHVLDTSGYLACDFHQHTLNSPDSTIPLEERVVTNLAEGLEFLSSSDHDYISDFRPIIASLGMSDRMDSVPGEELTPFGFGHFIAWPLPIDPLSPSLGALDWGGGNGPSLPPGALFDELRRMGARVVQINHPRLAAPSPFDFQQNFDRAALRFDFTRRTFYGDRNAMPVEASELGLPEDAEVFSDRFNSLEVFNGLDNPEPDRDGERHSTSTERILRDYMNFLSLGFTPAAVGSSDTHMRAEPSGLPRTLVRVGDDSPAALRAGVGDAVAATLTAQGGARRDLFATSGPVLQLSAGSGARRVGIGGTTQPEPGPGPGGETLHIEATALCTEWAPIDTIEVFANSTFPSPEVGPEPPEMIPAICFTSRPSPAERCRRAAVFGTLTVTTIDRPRGGRYLRAAVAVDVPVATLLAANSPLARGKDLWLLARAFGDRSLFPVVPGGLRADSQTELGALLNGTPITSSGTYPLAFTNPVFVDVDGGGWRAPFQP